MSAEPPWGDREGLLDWTFANFPRISALVLERLLTHHGFVEVGRLPTAGAVTAAVWAHCQRDVRRELISVRPVVYHLETASEQSIQAVLRACRAASQLGVADARPDAGYRSAP